MCESMTVAALAVLLAGVPHDAIKAEVERAADGLIAMRREIHQHPELANREYRTGKRVAARLRELGLQVRYPVARTGVVGILRGGRTGPVVTVRADMDALPIDERDGPYKSRNPGVMHACGHDVHTAVVAGVAEVLSRLRGTMPGTVVFLFQPAEEGPPPGEEGGAALVLKEGALNDPMPRAIFGLHVDPSLPVGQVGWSDGAVFASSDRFTIEIVGKPAHGAYPHTGVDPIPAAAATVQALQSLVSRRADARIPTVLSIGRIQGGTRANILAERVVMEGTLRTLDAHVAADLKKWIEGLIEGIASAHGAAGAVSFAPGVPPLVNDAALVRSLVPELVRGLGRERVVEVPPQMGGEDFALYAERLPAFYMKLGVRNEARGVTAAVHTDAFSVDEDAIGIGVRALSALVWAVLAREP